MENVSEMSAKTGKTPFLGMVLMCVCALAVMLVGVANIDGLLALIPEKPVPADWRAPEGYTLAHTENTGTAYGYRWEKEKGLDCSFSGPCWALHLISAKGCNGLRVEANLLDASQKVIGTKSEQAISVAPDRHNKLIFQPFPEKPETLSVGKAVCW